MSPRLGRLAIAFLFAFSLSAHAQIPQTQPYQVTLRNYLATLTESDFEMALQPYVYSNAFTATPDSLFAHWLWHENRTFGLPAEHRGLRVPATAFVLTNIEANGQVRMRVGRSAFFDPVGIAWWSQWPFPGNPHRPGTANSLAARRRAFVGAAVDLMMLDAYNSQDNGVRSDYMGGSLIRQAYVYGIVKSTLPPEVQAAYEAGLRRLFERIEGVSPGANSGADMETFQIVGLWYAAEAIGDDDLRARALARAQAVLDAIIRPAGYEHHGYAFDSSYMGIALRFMTWAGFLYRDQRISQTLDGMLRLKAYLNLPEPGSTNYDGVYVGPSHFNTGTDESAVKDQWYLNFRDAGDAMQSDEALYLMYGGRDVQSYMKPLGYSDQPAMRSDISGWIDSVNYGYYGDEGLTTPTAAVSAVWSQNYWNEGINYAHDFAPTGFWGRLRLLRLEGSPLTLPPFSRRPGFVRAFADDFLMVKIGNYGAIIHADVIRDQWNGHVSGLSGGSLSAFWTPVTGTVLLGLNGGSQNTTGYETWSGWSNWAVHAISGADAAGRPFSSARNRNPSATFELYGQTAAVATVSGTIGTNDAAMSAPGGAITGAVAYTRVFTCTPTGLSVRTTLTSDQSDPASELWEILPIHMRASPQTTNAIVEFRSGSSWTPASSALATNVSRVRITRFGESVQIVFAEPRRVRMSPAITNRSASYTWNLMVDMLGDVVRPATMPASQTVAYVILPPQPRLQIMGLPADYGSPKSRGYGWHTNLAYNTWITNRVGHVYSDTNGFRHLCAGWTLATNGVFSQSGSTTQAVFRLGTNAVLTWLWTNVYQLTILPGANGSIAGTNGWRAGDSTVTLAAAAAPYYRLAAWQGDVPPGAGATNPLALVMDRPRAVAAAFTENVGPRGVPERWLAERGLTNFPGDESGDPDADGQATWQEYVAGSDPTNGRSAFSVRSPAAPLPDGGLVVRWGSATGRQYRVERATNLAAGFDRVLQSGIQARPPENTYTDRTANVLREIFFRVITESGP